MTEENLNTLINWINGLNLKDNDLNDNEELINNELLQDKDIKLNLNEKGYKFK